MLYLFRYISSNDSALAYEEVGQRYSEHDSDGHQQCFATIRQPVSERAGVIVACGAFTIGTQVARPLLAFVVDLGLHGNAFYLSALTSSTNLVSSWTGLKYNVWPSMRGYQFL